MPSQSTLKKSEQGTRLRAGNTLPNPAPLENLVIPPAYAQTLHGESFLSFDGGAEDGEAHTDVLHPVRNGETGAVRRMVCG